MITTYDLMAQTWGGTSPDLKTKPGAPTRPDRSLLQLKPHSAAGSEVAASLGWDGMIRARTDRKQNVSSKLQRISAATRVRAQPLIQRMCAYSFLSTPPLHSVFFKVYSTAAGT